MKTGITIVTVLVTILAVGPSAAQQLADSQVEQASFGATSRERASGDSAQRVSFSRQAVRVGDEVEQILGFELRMTMTMRQGNEMVGKSQTTVRTNQKRVLTTTEV